MQYSKPMSSVTAPPHVMLQYLIVSGCPYWLLLLETSILGCQKPSFKYNMFLSLWLSLWLLLCVCDLSPSYCCYSHVYIIMVAIPIKKNINPLCTEVENTRWMHDIVGQAWASACAEQEQLHTHDCHQNMTEHSTTSSHRISLKMHVQM